MPLVEAEAWGFNDDFVWCCAWTWCCLLSFLFFRSVGNGRVSTVCSRSAIVKVCISIPLAKVSSG